MRAVGHSVGKQSVRPVPVGERARPAADQLLRQRGLSEHLPEAHPFRAAVCAPGGRENKDGGKRGGQALPPERVREHEQDRADHEKSKEKDRIDPVKDDNRGVPAPAQQQPQRGGDNKNADQQRGRGQESAERAEPIERETPHGQREEQRRDCRDHPQQRQAPQKPCLSRQQREQPKAGKRAERKAVCPNGDAAAESQNRHKRRRQRSGKRLGRKRQNREESQEQHTQCAEKRDVPHGGEKARQLDRRRDRPQAEKIGPENLADRKRRRDRKAEPHRIAHQPGEHAAPSQHEKHAEIQHKAHDSLIAVVRRPQPTRERPEEQRRKDVRQRKHAEKHIRSRETRTQRLPLSTGDPPYREGGKKERREDPEDERLCSRDVEISVVNREREHHAEQRKIACAQDFFCRYAVFHSILHTPRTPPSGSEYATTIQHLPTKCHIKKLKKPGEPQLSRLIMTISDPYLLMMSRVSRAMTSSSFVGMTKTLTLLSGVEIITSSPRFALAASSSLTPR